MHPTRHGFGTRVLEGMIRQQRGEMHSDCRAEGLACEIAVTAWTARGSGQRSRQNSIYYWISGQRRAENVGAGRTPWPTTSIRSLRPKCGLLRRDCHANAGQFSSDQGQLGGNFLQALCRLMFNRRVSRGFFDSLGIFRGLIDDRLNLDAHGKLLVCTCQNHHRKANLDQREDAPGMVTRRANVGDREPRGYSVPVRTRACYAA